MKSNNNQTAKSGLGFTGALTLLFIGLKLAKVIDWPWIWVLSPIWISTVLVILFLLIAWLITRDRKPRKATWCIECEYRGCSYSDGFQGLRFHCRKHDKYVRRNDYCMEGQRKRKEKKNAG